MHIMMENAHNDGNRYQPAFKTAFRNSVPHHKEVHWLPADVSMHGH